MTIPDYQTLMLPVLKAAKKEVYIRDVIEELANVFALSDQDRSELLPSGAETKFSNRVHWAKSYLVQANLVEITRRGHFRITERGSKVLQSNPKKIDNAFLFQFEEFREFKARSNKDKAPSSPAETAAENDQKQTPDESMRAAHSLIDETLAINLLDRIRKSSPAFFEKLIVNLLISMKYGGSSENAGRAIGKSGDDGVDGVIDQDALGLDRVYIQAKRYALGNSVGPAAIRDFFGSLDLHKAHKGIFVTTSTFSSAAEETAEKQSKRIVLINGVQLAKLMIYHNVGCRIEETLYIKKMDEEFFES